MPKSKEACEKIREETKNKIIDAAIEVFARKGYAATNTSDIAKKANISDGLLYRYFNSKQELFEYIANFAIGGLIEVTQILSGDGNPKDIINGLCQEMLDHLDNLEFIYLNMTVIQGFISEDNSVCQTILEQDNKMLEAAANLIQRGQSEGVFTDGDSKAKSALLFSLIQGMVLMKFLLKDGFTLPTLTEMTAFLY